MMDSSLLSLLACPKCHGKLAKDGKHSLVCSSCHLSYPVENGLPVLLIEKAVYHKHPSSSSPS